MLKTLLHKQMTEIFRSYFYDAKKNKKRSKASTTMFFAIYVILMVGVLGGIFTYLSISMCEPMVIAGAGWLYFTIMSLIAIALGAFGSVFNTYSGLYLSKDNDLLLSMPIPVRYIMISRLLGVYLIGLMYSEVVMLPAIIVYWVIAAPGAAAVVCSLVLALLVSVIVMLLSCLLGWVVAKVSLKLKNKSFITVLVSLLFFGVYYFISFKAQDIIQDLIVNVSTYGAKIKASAYPLYFLGRMGEGYITAAVVVTVIVAVLTALLWFLLSRSFIGIATSTAKATKTVYKEKAEKVKSVSSALFGKEMRRFTASPSYMLNCGLGIVFLFIGGVALLIKGNYLGEVLKAAFVEQPDTVPVLLCAAICAMISAIDITAPSISLEGKSIWLAQSLPVNAWQVLKAKLKVQILLSGVPALFCTLCGVFTLKMTLAESLITIAIIAIYTLLAAVFGLVLGLKMPNLTWTNEITPIKQGGSVMFAMFGGWAYCAIIALPFFFFAYPLGAAAYLGCIAALSLIISVILFVWCKKKGAEIFSNLSCN